MTTTVLGVSGSPIGDGNTDRVVQRVLAATGLDSEFVRLWDVDVQPCKACLACASTDTCTGFDDDWAKLASNVVRAQAFVIGGWMPFGILDARTKAFLERTFSLRYSILLNAGKLGVAIITGTIDPNPTLPRRFSSPAEGEGHTALRLDGRQALATRCRMHPDRDTSSAEMTPDPLFC